VTREANDSTHWSEHARRWAAIRSPLRPGATDLAQVERALVRHISQGNRHLPARALLCGVTPELAQLPLPLPMELLAFDQSAAMIAAVWPGDNEQRRARVGDWFALDLADASVGIALGDGCFSLLDYPEGYERFAASLARVLAPGALFSIRLFCRPEVRETLAAVLEALQKRQIGNFHAFKWRLAMALQGDEIAHGIAVETIWSVFQQRVGEAPELAARMGWALEEVQTIDNYRGSSAVYTYPTVREVSAVLGGRFELLEEWRGEYELAERCPQLLFRRR